MNVSTVCQTCRREYDVTLEDLRRGYSSWTVCPLCREQKATENRAKLEQAMQNRAEEDTEHKRGAA